MGRFTEEGKEFELFKNRYKVKLIMVKHIVLPFGLEMENKTEILAYYCKSHDAFYQLVKYDDDFHCWEFEGDEIFIPENVIGIGSGEEITVGDLDAMFSDWEEYVKKLKPATDENINKLLEEYPILDKPVILEDIFKVGGGISYGNLKTQLDALHTAEPSKVKNALGALIKNLELEKDSQNEDATKIQVERIVDGKKKKTKEYMKTIKRGEVWRVNFTRGVGHEIQDERPALVISTDSRNATLGTIMCLGIEGYEARHSNTQINIVPEDITYAGQLELDRNSRVELVECFTLDRARFSKKYGILNPDKMQEVLEKFKKYYELPDDRIEPIELVYDFDDEE